MKIILICLSLFTWTMSQTTKNQFQESIDDRAEQFETIAKSIWDWAEMGYQEEKSSSLLQQTLKEEGFSMQAGVAGLPTAFIASAEKTKGSIAPINNPTITIGSITSIDVKLALDANAANKARAVRAAEAIAKPFPIAAVVLPTASN